MIKAGILVGATGIDGQRSTTTVIGPMISTESGISVGNNGHTVATIQRSRPHIHRWRGGYYSRLTRGALKRVRVNRIIG